MVKKDRNAQIHVQAYPYSYATIKGEVRNFEGRTIRTSKGLCKVIGITIDNKVDLQLKRGRAVGRISLPLHKFYEELNEYN